MAEQSTVIASLGVGYFHGTDFLIDRPAGAGEFVFLHFLAPIAMILHGRPTNARVGHCIAFSPATPQYYRGLGGGLANDWFHFRGPGIQAMLDRHGILCDQLLAPHTTAFIAPALREVESEMTRRRRGWERAAELLIERFFIMLARSIASQHHQDESPRRAELRATFEQLRIAIDKDLAHRWTVPEMAERVHLGRSRFLSLYKEFFDSTPVDDLIDARLRRARWLLTNTALSVGHVAAECGMDDIYYFSRLFRRRVGCPPSRYYDSLTGRK